MNSSDIARLRLHHQQLATPTFREPGEVVAWLGAVQAQDYLGSLWAIGLRMRDATEAAVEGAIADRTIVRTWPMRGTLHFVPASDARWMLALLTPRVVKGSASRFRELELDDAVFARSRELFVAALQGGKQLTRDAMYQVLEAGQISTAGQRGIHILGRLAQDGLICHAAREGKQQTFALLDEWVPALRDLQRDEALAELAHRYFRSHGPATLQDFVWWSGLTVADARAGLAAVEGQLTSESIDGQAYWLASSQSNADVPVPTAHFLPMYDELLVAYRDRSAALDPDRSTAAGNGIFRPVVVVEGRVVGTWTRALKKDAVVITPQLFTTLTDAEQHAFSRAARRYGSFLNRPVIVA